MILFNIFVSKTFKNYYNNYPFPVTPWGTCVFLQRHHLLFFLFRALLFTFISKRGK